MEDKKSPGRQFDTPWKVSLQNFFPKFLSFYFENIYQDIDWRIPPVHLNTELQPEDRDSKVGRRHVDHLVQVTLKDGEASIILIHTEIQCQRDDGITERLLNYIARIRSVHGLLPVTLLILGDDDPAWKMEPIAFERWGYQLFINIPTVKLLDHKGKEQALLQSANPFAIMTLAHLYALQAAGDEPHRMKVKKNLIQLLLHKNFPPEEMAHLMNFLDYTLPLDDIPNKALWSEAKKEFQNMRHLAPIFQEVYDEGEAKGEARGEAKGEVRGRIDGKAEVLLRQLGKKFGPLPADAFERVGEATVEQIDLWLDRVLDCDRLESIWA